MVLERMTLTEKLDMVRGIETGPFVTGPYAGSTVGVGRLCIPALHLVDGPAGIGNGLDAVTQLPAPIGLASSWDTDLAHRYGEVIGAEARAKGASVSLGPTVNLVRDPRWGRGFETYGEDPVLTSGIGVADIEGVQSQQVVAMVKHLAVYNQEVHRAGPDDDVVVDERTLRELYLPAFEAAVRDGDVGAVMCAYSTIGGVPACANQHLMGQVLKGQWAFPGFVATDWSAPMGGPEAALAGLDLQMPDGCYFGPALRQAIAAGDVPISRLDDMVGRILAAMFRSGVVDHPPTGTPTSVAATASHAAVAKEAAAEGTVLLRNDGVLPLDPDATQTIAVIGDAAGSDDLSAGGGSAAVRPTDRVTPLDGIRARVGGGTRVVVDDGTDPARAARLAAGADVALVFASRFDQEGQDHPDLALPGGADATIDAVARSQPRTVVVLGTGGPVVMPWLDRAAGVVEHWYGGEQGGAALAAILFGDVNPSGKLPVTFPRSVVDLPTATAEQFPGRGGHVLYSEGLRVGYRAVASGGAAPLFPFGFGLSYTSFAFSDLRVVGPDAAGNATVSVRITNTGTRAGADVAQLYLTSPAPGEPPRQLRAFARVDLEPGASRTVELHLDARSFSSWDDATRRWIAPAGEYQVFVGDSSADLPLSAPVTLAQPLVGPQSEPSTAAAPRPQFAAQLACPIDALAPLFEGAFSGLPNDQQDLITGIFEPLLGG
jgi:beta-glucosidase